MIAVKAVSTERADSSIAIGSKFKEFGPEDEKSARKAEVKEDTMQQLVGAWCAYECSTQMPARYRDAVSNIKGIRYSEKDVEEFSIVLGQFQREHYFMPKAGLFLSALINEGEDEDYLIHTKPVGGNITALGLYNTKNVTVVGNLAFLAGERMEGGRLLIKGDVGGSLGSCMGGGMIEVEGSAAGSVGCWMRGGSILIHGDADYNIGVKMKRGRIDIRGNLPESGYDNGSENWHGLGGDNCYPVGHHMEGGEIHIQVDAPYISKHTEGGKIFNKGKRIDVGNEPRIVF